MHKGSFFESIKFVEVEDLQRTRFKFINDETLRENIAIKMQYIVFLASMGESYELPGAVAYSVFQTIILTTASIIESLIHYKLGELVEKGECDISKLLAPIEKIVDGAATHKKSETEKIIGVLIKTRPRSLTDDIQFIELNRAAKKCGLFTEALFDKAESLRKMRNRIHISALKEVDDKYTKNDINRVFKDAKEIIDRIEMGDR